MMKGYLFGLLTGLLLVGVADAQFPQDIQGNQTIPPQLDTRGLLPPSPIDNWFPYYNPTNRLSPPSPYGNKEPC